VTLTSRQLVDFICGPQSKPKLRGAARHLPLGDERSFVEQLAAAVGSTGPDAQHGHPAESAPLISRGGQHGPLTLQPVDVAWLQRLPTDPRQIDDADAAQLASLARATAPRTGDRRLVDSIWLPVKALHDVKVAEANLANAKRPLADLPATALAVMTEAVRREVSGLTEDEVVARAARLLREALDKRVTEHDRRIQKAEAQLHAVRSKGSRESLTA